MNQEEQAKKNQKVIAKAWTDEAFKKRLLSNPSETLRGEGIDVPGDVEVRAVENTNTVVYFVLPPKPENCDLEELEQRAAAFLLWY